MRRELPKAGETWRHYKGKSCLVLGVLSNGNPLYPRNPIVALELIESTSSYNNETRLLESTRIVRTRFYRTVDEFMSSIKSEYRFEKVVDDDEEIWGNSIDLDLDANLQM